MVFRNGDDLSERKKAILRAVVDAYILGGEPVGSKYLTQQSGIQLSSATIRNEMAELENLGYLEQPHTSAGRIPSEQGYRFYVDALMQHYRMTANELRELNALTNSKAAELNSILERAGKLMSMFTNYTSLTARPSGEGTTISHYKAVRVDSDSFLLIMITAQDEVRTRYIHRSESVSDACLTLLEDTLNRFAVGLNCEHFTLPVMLEIQNSMAGYETVLPAVTGAIYEVLGDRPGGDVKIEGIGHLLNYPECSDRQTLSGLLGLPDHKNDILDMLSGAKPDTVHVYIGSENRLDVMRNSSLVFRTISSGGHVVGAIGVIGPCRMDYSKVITALEYLSGNISDLMNSETGPSENSPPVN